AAGRPRNPPASVVAALPGAREQQRHRQVLATGALACLPCRPPLTLPPETPLDLPRNIKKLSNRHETVNCYRFRGVGGGDLNRAARGCDINWRSRLALPGVRAAGWVARGGSR